MKISQILHSFLTFCLCFCPCFCVAHASLPAQTVVVKQWEFDKDGDRENWTVANQIKDVSVGKGFLRGVCSGDDPFFVSQGFEFETSVSQVVEIRYRTNLSGQGNLFFTNTTEEPYGGFRPQKNIAWKVVGDSAWHTARIFPGWNAEKKIIKLRVDFPHPAMEEIDKTFYEIDWIRVIDLNFAKAPKVRPDWDFTHNASGWKAFDGSDLKSTSNGWSGSGKIETNPISFDADECGTWIAVEMSVDSGKTGQWTILFDDGRVSTVDFPIQPGGKQRWYNVDALKTGAWQGKIHFMQLTPSDNPKAKAVVKRIVVAENPQGPAEIVLERVYQPEGINRVGKPMPLALRLRNDGGTTAKDVHVDDVTVKSLKNEQDPIRWKPSSGAPKLDIGPLETKTLLLSFDTLQPFDGDVDFTFTGTTFPTNQATIPIRVDSAVSLPPADYVPRPQPVESDYTIGALYFPGWSAMDRWERIYSTHPERKPVLGWYDEGNPEVIDWQIKWSLENGIQYYLVDWYWHQGNQHLDHWVKGFYKTRYKSMFKWAMMWANHNPPGSHSEEDQRALTKFWIENYFKTPEYLTRDGRPIVMIWSPANMDNDMIAIESKKGNTLKKGEGVKRLLDISQQMAKDAGLKGIYFVAMKWPEASTNPSDIQWLADAGFEMTSIYHFMAHGGKAKNPLRFPFELVIDASSSYLENRHETGILPFLPNLSTGWDSRPWHGEEHVIIEGRTVDGFHKICHDFKKFSEKTGIRDILLAPTNEWGEGSYAEPNAEYGFGMFETVRDTFCKKPSGGWPINYGPADVGLGPYDLPALDRNPRTAWDFQDDSQGWNAMMGVKNMTAKDGKLVFETTTHDPAISASVEKLRAANWSRLIVRMKISSTDGSSSQDMSQIFWSTTTSPVSEANSIRVPVKVDGHFHEYVYDLKPLKTWRREITGLRFDPVNSAAKKIEIESIKFE